MQKEADTSLLHIYIHYIQRINLGEWFLLQVIEVEKWTLHLRQKVRDRKDLTDNIF